MSTPGFAALVGAVAFVAVQAASHVDSSFAQWGLAIAAGALTAALTIRAIHRASAPLRRQSDVMAAKLAGLERQRAADKDALCALNAWLSTLRHDLRGVLSPVLLISDRLLNNPDPSIKRAGELTVRAVTRASELLSKAASPEDPPAAKDE